MALGHDDGLDELAVLARGDAVVDEIVFQRQGAAGVALAQYYLRAQGNQQRRRITNRRSVADIAAQGALVANLQGGEALQQFAEVRVFMVQRGVAVGEGGGRADFQAVVELLDALHGFNVADVDHHRQGAVELGDFQRQVSAAGQQPGLWVGVIEVGQVGNGQWHQAALVTTVEFAGLGRRDSLEAGDGFSLAAVELIQGLVAAGLFGGGENRAITGAAAQIAGQGFMGFVAVGGVAVLLQGKQRHHEARGAKAAL